MAVTHNSTIHWPCSTRLQLEPLSTRIRLRGSPGLPADDEEKTEAARGPSAAAKSRAVPPLAAMLPPPGPGSEGRWRPPPNCRRGGGAAAGARRARGVAVGHVEAAVVAARAAVPEGKPPRHELRPCPRECSAVLERVYERLLC